MNVKIEDLNWEKVDGLMPAVVQDAVTHKVLMVGYMNQEALRKTKETDLVTFFSRTRKELWTKGETSGNSLKLVSLYEDCDRDCLLVKASPAGPTCHTGADTCFNEVNSTDFGFLTKLEAIIAKRANGDDEKSYTASLLRSGTKRIAQKVGEEGVEVALAATANDTEELKNESADLLYHLLVLLRDQDINFAEIVQTLENRHN